MLDQLMTKVAILGAAGKMGSGIALLNLQEMAMLAIKNPSVPFVLMLIDLEEARLRQLKAYLKKHLLKFAEKQINQLRQLFRDSLTLISNEEIIQAFMEKGLEIIKLETNLLNASQAGLIYEAMSEDSDLKIKVLKQIYQHSENKPLILSNTSSIPISFLDDEAGLDHHLLGFHFYNPPAVQKLLELVIPEGVPQVRLQVALDLAKRLKKTVVKSRDVAGFIGNGHFLREIVFACEAVRELSQDMPQAQALVLVNQITQQLLVRPMGIFQLVDYVGIDVVDKIGKVMATFLKQPSLHDPLIARFILEKVLGGQNPDGSQKEGIFQYQQGIPAAVYNLVQKHYEPIQVADLVTPDFSWKKLQKDPLRNDKLKQHFLAIQRGHDPSVVWARKFLENSRQIAENLVKDQVAEDLSDVDTVLMNGFFHLYGTQETFYAGAVQ